MAAINIRWAAPDDWAQVKELSKKLHSEAAWYNSHPFDEDHAHKEYLRRINGGDRFSFVVELEGQIVGILVGFFSTLHTCPLKIATEEIVYVLPEYRSMKIGFLLIREMENWAEFNGADVAKVGNSTGITSSRTAERYKAMGYQPYSDVFLKELPNER
ncbi:GNAT family N-acetyltransferase [Parendozoicomonas haliclonae]|uniref:Acetyltransferase (GNAT) family protein n=1 Tax=Parendozoicomonas haliclonae TaxID=1960125 RepID=A0A1X7AEK8_9GAMM|nr:GNAT family N-acetyltransferase [Parendozoicomonas haliclonae]SMA33321.1 Acetyltransferase (GNAT) family protein [Parendozoicomonas haliclonae]